MGKMSREKGKSGERELANKLKEYGYNCRRGQQFSGSNGDADVVGLPGIHIECKRVEKLNLYDAVAQSKSDAREGEMPAVFHRRNNAEWLVTIPLEHFMEIYKEWEAGQCKE
ncbi:Holliday junction resolvase [Clostridiales Family XIII bacterium PM5-7]